MNSTSNTGFSLPYTSCNVTIGHGFKEIAEQAGTEFDALDKVYHSSSRHEMEVNADLMGVDLCNPFVLLFLAKQTTYHHAFWPHTAKRFTAFKNVLRHNKRVRKHLFDDCAFLALANDEYGKLQHNVDNCAAMNSPGRRQQLANWKQVISIVEKAIKEQSK